MTINRLKKLALKSPFEMGLLAAMIILVCYFAYPAVVKAMSPESFMGPAVNLQIAAMQNATKSYGVLPTADERGPSYTMTVTATAYNSVPEQTDSTPFITASGSHTRHGVIAANFLPIGTRLKIPAYYGDQVFVVEDRMNPRYHQRIDIWMEEVPDARAFGVRNVEIEIYNE